MKLILRILLLLAGLAVLALLGAVAYFVNDTKPPATAAELAVPVPEYGEVAVVFTHRYGGSDVQLPAMGAAVFDVDGDGRDEIFASGGSGQDDALLRWNGDALEAMDEPFVIVKEGGSPSYGAAAVDADGDGRIDLFVSRGDGLTLYLNKPSGFEARRVENHLNDKTAGISLAAVDLNHDGWVDFFVSGYLHPEHIEGLTIFTDPTYGGSSVLLLNRGDNTFTDITTQAGLDYVHNTFQAVFVDADGDLDQDLIVAHDTGEVRIYRNLEREGRPLSFEKVDNPTTGHFAYPMGIGVGDADADGLPDFLFPNTGTTVPRFMAKGDLEDDTLLNLKWILLDTGPGMSFTDVSDTARVADYEFGWGAAIADLNLDGRQDLVAAENFVDFPVHRFLKLPGRYLLQNPDGTFAPAGEQAGAENPFYGIAPMVAELDGDGLPDLIFVNLDGPLRALVSRGTSGGGSLTVAVPDTPEFLSAKAVVTLDDGRELVDWFIGSEGLCTDPPSRLIFGLGDSASVRSVHVVTASGEEYAVESPAVGSVVTIGSAQLLSKDFASVQIF